MLVLNIESFASYSKYVLLSYLFCLKLLFII